MLFQGRELRIGDKLVSKVMLFQGRELRIGDKLVSKRWGEITVLTISRECFEVMLPDGLIREWDYEGRYVYFEEEGIDATWPEAEAAGLRSVSFFCTVCRAHYETEQEAMACTGTHLPHPTNTIEPKAPDREAEYRRLWIERATARYDFDITNRPHDELPGFAVDAFDAADAFIAELRKREGK